MGTLVRITKMTMTTTDKTNTRKKTCKIIRKIIAQEHLYTDEQLREMKQALRVVEERNG